MSFVHRWKAGKGAVILALHGTGGDENDLMPLAEMIDPRAAVLSPRGRVLEGSANRFFRRFGEGRFDLENMREETEALAGFLVEAGREHGFDPADVTALGFSNGANIAVSLLFRRPELLSKAILLRAMVPFEPESPLRLEGKRVFLANGRHDPIVPLENAERLATLLRGAGADVKHMWLETAHNLTREEVLAAKEWLAS
jgi:phospholipase/carboxylesterase